MNTTLLVSKPTAENKKLLKEHCEWTASFGANVCFNTVNGEPVPHCEELKQKLNHKDFAIITMEDYEKADKETYVQALLSPKEDWQIWLEGLETNNSFFLNMQSLSKMDKMTDNMKVAVQRSYQEELEKSRKPKIEGTYTEGTVIEINRFMALTLELATGHKGYTLEILKTLRETEKAIHVKVKYSGKFKSRCSCCGLKLTNAISKISGIGPDCAAKMNIERATNEESAKEQARQLDIVLGMKQESTVWIPRKSIKGTI